MKSISTHNLHLLPSPAKLREICTALAALDAIVCPEKQSRCFRYRSSRNSYSSLFHYYNGIGDHMHIFFSEFGTFINGFASESVMNCQREMNSASKFNNFCGFFTLGNNASQTPLPLWDGLTTNLPAYFHEFLVNDPVRMIGSTFCIWNINHKDSWEIGDITFPDDDYLDGSEELLSLFDGNPNTYLVWASEYYDLYELDIFYLEYIYDHRIIDYDIVRTINPEFTQWHQLKKELDWIGYPNEL